MAKQRKKSLAEMIIAVTKADDNFYDPLNRFVMDRKVKNLFDAKERVEVGKETLFGLRRQKQRKTVINCASAELRKSKKHHRKLLAELKKLIKDSDKRLDAVIDTFMDLQAAVECGDYVE